MGKIVCRIMIDSIRSGVDDRLRKEQAGYRKGSGTTEQVFILRNIVEQVNEWQATLYLNSEPRKHVGNYKEVRSPIKDY